MFVQLYSKPSKKTTKILKEMLLTDSSESFAGDFYSAYTEDMELGPAGSRHGETTISEPTWVAATGTKDIRNNYYYSTYTILYMVEETTKAFMC